MSINPEWPECIIEIKNDHSRERQAIDEGLRSKALVCKTIQATCIGCLTRLLWHNHRNECEEEGENDEYEESSTMFEGLQS